MKQNSKLIVLSVIFLTVALLLCACTERNDIIDATPTVNPTEKPEISGKQVKDGVIDISEKIQSAIGSGYEVVDSVFFAEDTLLVASESMEESKLTLYNIRTAQVVTEYVLPFSINDSTCYSLRNVINVCDDKILIVDFINDNVFELDNTLTETVSYPGTAPKFDDVEFLSLSLAYSESENALYYSEPTQGAIVFKRTLADNVVTEFFATGIEGDSLSFEATEDCAYLNVHTYNYTDTSGTVMKCTNRDYTIKTATGEVTNDTWLNHVVYSDGNDYAEGSYYHYLSYIRCDGVTLQPDYIHEISQMSVDFEGNTAITSMGTIEGDTNVLVFSAYDLDSGERMSRIVFDVEPWAYISRNYISGTSSTGYGDLYCVVYNSGSVIGDDVEVSDRHVVIWTPSASVDEKVDEGYTGLILNPKIEIPDTVTAETNVEYTEDIESRYPVEVYYGQETEDNFDKQDGTTSYISLTEETDPCYVYELLNLLDDVLSQYPDGMLEQLSSSDEGKMCFFLVMDLSDSALEFDICGLYTTPSDTQDFLIEINPISFDDFSRNGSVGNFYSIMHHEICHGIQRAIFSNYDGDVLYDYDEYVSYWPEDYTFDDEDKVSKYIYCDPEDVYFVDEYASTSILEDMSRMYEYAMWDIIPEQILYPRVNARYKYLCELIRSTFDKEGAWGDEVMPWERAITDNKMS